MIHLHICPTEIAAFFQLYEAVALYYTHYKHIMMSAFTKWYSKDCELCQQGVEHDA